MSLPITIPNTFATETNNIPLSDLDANFTTVTTAINGIGNGSEALANVVVTGGTISGVTATNVTANVVSISNATITGGSITGITPIAVVVGGTGANSAATARTNLGAAASGANSDITALSGLTTALSVAQGGTGSANLTAASVLIGNGTSAVTGVAPGTSGNVLTSNGTAWTSSVLPSLGVGQTWTSVTRTSGTTYTNSTSSPIAIQVYIQTGGTTAYGFTQISVNGGSNIMMAIAYRDVATGFFIIPPGATYVLTDTGLSTRTTNELR